MAGNFFLKVEVWTFWRRFLRRPKNAILLEYARRTGCKKTGRLIGLISPVRDP